MHHVRVCCYFLLVVGKRIHGFVTNSREKKKTPQIKRENSSYKALFVPEMCRSPQAIRRERGQARCVWTGRAGGCLWSGGCNGLHPPRPLAPLEAFRTLRWDSQHQVHRSFSGDRVMLGHAHLSFLSSWALSTLHFGHSPGIKPQRPPALGTSRFPRFCCGRASAGASRPRP